MAGKDSGFAYGNGDFASFIFPDYSYRTDDVCRDKQLG